MSQHFKTKEAKGGRFMRTPFAALLLGCVALSGQVSAAGWADRVSLGGFASSNFAITDDAVPFNGGESKGYDSSGSWADTRVGLIVNANVNKRLRFATQMFAVKEDEFNLRTDWAFADLTLTKGLNLRAGKVKFPIGLVNEYVDVGYAMPWMRAPVVIYSELGAPNGPQMTRAGYTGASLLGETGAGDWSFAADVFTGEISLELGSVRSLIGTALTADWDDTILLKASAYEGTMHGFSGMTAMMEGVKHRGTMVGFKADWNNVLVYAEHAQISMGDLDAMKATSWYATLGYQIGKVLPHVTYQSFKQGVVVGDRDEQNITTAGLRWDWAPGVALKMEASHIRTPEGVGLFDGAPSGSVNMVSVGIDTVF